jgi:hypothetical protein
LWKLKSLTANRHECHQRIDEFERVQVVARISPMMARFQERTFQPIAVKADHFIPRAFLGVSGKQNAPARVVNANDDTQVV